MSNIWPNDVPLVEDGKTTFSAADMNPIINALVARTNYLKNVSHVTGAKNGYSITDIGFTADCTQGTLVYYNPEEGKYYPAKALWDSANTDNNGLRAGMESYVKGVVITPIAADTTATILCEGWLADDSLCTKLIPSKQAGNYYLTENGELSQVPSKNVPVVFCCTYTTSGKLYISPKEPQVFGHSHAGVTVAGTSFTQPQAAMNVPDTAKAVYDLTTDNALRSLLTASKDSALLIGNGILLNKGTWGFTDVYLYTNFAVHADDVYTVYGVTPILGDLSIVRNVRVEPTNKLLTASVYNNVVQLNTTFPTITTTDMSAQCVTNVTNNGISYGPVIHELTAGAGVNLYRNNQPGSFTIAASAAVDTFIDLNLVNADGVLLGGDTTGVYMTFPTGQTSAIVGTLRIPAHNISALRMLPVLLVKGTGKEIPAFTINLTTQAMPVAAGQSTPVANTFTYNTSALANTDSGSIYRVELSNADKSSIAAISNAFVTMRVSAAPTTAVAVLAAGIYLTK